MNIFELLTTQKVLDYAQSINPTFNALSSLFPDITTEEEQLIITTDDVDYNESAHPVADNTEAPLAQRPGFSKSIQDISTFKLAYRLTDTEIRKLKRAQTTLSQDENLAAVFDDVGRLVRAHEIVNERMRAQALVEGKIQFTDEYNFSPDPVEFGIPTDQFKNFDFEKGDFLEFLFKAKQTIRERTGYDITRMILSDSIVFKLCGNEAMKSVYSAYNTTQLPRLTPNQLSQIFSEHVGIQYSVPRNAEGSVYGYNTSKTPGKKEIVPFIPTDKVILLPGGPLGNTVHGITTEELTLRDTPDIKLEKRGYTVITSGFDNNPVNEEFISVSRSTITYPKAPASVVITDQASGPTTWDIRTKKPITPKPEDK